MTDNISAAMKNVTRTYGGVAVLDSASLDIEPGLTAVIGPNGSGKSTLLGVLAGVVEPTAGRVRRPKSDGMKPIGYLPQRVPFREGFTARETLAFYAQFVDANPDTALDSVGLSDAADRRVEALSGGMRRLLGIAQATLGDPSLVVLDEPTSGLDPGMRERAFGAAAARTAGDTAVVLSSHDLELVDTYADYVAVLDRGRVIAFGGVEALCDEYGVTNVTELYRAAVDGGTGRTGPIGDADGDTTDTDSERLDGVHVPGASDR
ncbi:hypothetical protein JCM17823_06620 [Halorubrum gandharaense]